MVNISFFRFILLFIFSLTPLAFANVEASLNRSSMQLGETVQLTISIDDTSFFGSPDTSVLNDKFDILGQQKSSQTSIINGKRTSITQWVYALSPKSAGVITIPSITINDEQSHPIALKVENPSNNSNTSNQPTFMEVSLNKNTVYVQEQLLLTLHINSSIDLQNIQLQPLQIDNATVTQLTNTRYQRAINGVPYTTYEVVYAITPQRSGDLIIPSIKAEGISPDPSDINSFFNNGRKIQLQTNELTLHVNASPNTNKTWLPANDMQLHETWSSDPENITVGDSISRTLEITATGLNAKQLPELTMQGNEFFKAYQDKANENDNKTDQGIVSTKKQNITLVATKAGKVELPAIDIQWWDVQSNTFKNTRLAPVTLHIKDNATSAQPAMQLPPAINNIPAITPNQNSAPTPTINQNLTASNTCNNNFLWQIIAVINGMFAFIFAGLWLNNKRHQKQKNTTPNESLVNTTNSNPLKALKIACINKQFVMIKTTLIEWAKTQYPTQKIHSLVDIQQLINNKDVSLWLTHLDKAIYKNEESNEDWLAFYEIIHRLQYEKIEKDKALPPLYPKN